MASLVACASNAGDVASGAGAAGTGSGSGGSSGVANNAGGTTGLSAGATNGGQSTTAGSTATAGASNGGAASAGTATGGTASSGAAAGGAGAAQGGTNANGGAAGSATGGNPHGGSSGSSNGGTSNGGAGGANGGTSNGGAGGSNASHWIPAKGTTFYWDLTNAPPDNGKNVGAYDIDGANNTAQEVAALHAKGIKVVCYMDAGTYEPGRPDSAAFPAALKGSGVSGWPGEYWLDVRAAGPNIATLKAIMLARFKVCQQKGFDAVEPDNLDSYQNKPGFATTAADQLAYNQWIATTVHGLGLAVFQKNDLDQVAQLEPYFDGILDEECNKYSECDTLAPYSAAGKPVWDAEYKEDGESTASFCSADVKAGIAGALFALDLDGSLFEPCTNDVGPVN